MCLHNHLSLSSEMRRGGHLEWRRPLSRWQTLHSILVLLRGALGPTQPS